MAKLYNRKGVSLLETLVVVTITSIMAISVMSILSSAVRVQSQTLHQQHVLDQATYVLELMTKDIKMAKRLRAVSPATLACGATSGLAEEVHIYELSGDNSLTFLDQRNNCITYFLEGTTIKMKKSNNNLSHTYFELPIISEDMKVLDLSFHIADSPMGGNNDGSCVNASLMDPCLQPRITISITIESSADRNKTEPIVLQVTFSARNINRIYANL